MAGRISLRRGEIMRYRGIIPWCAYCRTIALGSGTAAAYAKLCLACGGKGHKAARRRVERMLKIRTIDDEGYATRIDAIDTIEDMRCKGVQTYTVKTPLRDWSDMGAGAHQRRNHYSSGH